MPSSERGAESDSATPQFVVYLDGDARWIRTHGGPYTPMKAREVREAMEKHIANENYRDWSIPEDAEKVETVTKDELRELKEISLCTDGGADHNAGTPQGDKYTGGWGDGLRMALLVTIIIILVILHV